MLGDHFESRWKKHHPQGQVIYRELNQTVPHLTLATVASFHTPKEHWTADNKSALATSNELVEELKAADELVINSPLYNFNVASALKAYFDQIVREGYTFKRTPEHQGLLTHLRAHLLTVRGGYYTGTPLEEMDVQRRYLANMMAYLGIQVVQEVLLEGTANEEKVGGLYEQARQNIDLFFNQQQNTHVYTTNN
jgi:FMN-dependent NADH-azoreductase